MHLRKQQEILRKKHAGTVTSLFLELVWQGEMSTFFYIQKKACEYEISPAG